MTPEQKKHEEEYFAAKKKYEMAYANKAKYSREKAGAETKRQQLINSINSKKSELKKVSQTYTDLTKTNGKDNEIESHIQKAAKHLSAAATQFKNIGESSNGNQKDLEMVFSSKVAKSKKHISEAFSGIEKAKKNLSGRKTALNGEITKLNGELATVKTSITRYVTLIDEADTTMRTASVDMAYHKKHMTA
jgi:chromosome segregation ATPase